MLTFIVVSVSFCLEHNVEVVTSLQCQNSLISSCHEGLIQSIQSVAASGHLGKRNEIKEYFIIFIIWVCHVHYWCYLLLWFLNNAILIIFIVGRDKTFAKLHERYFFCMMRQCIQMHIKYCEPSRWLIPKSLINALLKCSQLKYQDKHGNK